MPAMRKQLILLGLILLVSTAVLLAGDKKSKSRNPEAALAGPTAAPMEDDKKIVHALNRFTFGARPGDVERVRALGLDQWFDQQLHPEKINDSAVQARLAPLRTLNMSTREMIENFPPPQVLKAIENGRMSMPSDPARRAVYESRMAAYQQRQQNKEDKGAAKEDKAAGTENLAMNEDQAMSKSSTGDKDPQARMRPGDN